MAGLSTAAFEIDDRFIIYTSGSGPDLPGYWVVAPATDQLHSHIGRVVTTWALVERFVNMFIEAMLLSTGRDEPYWKGQDFKRRSKLFKALVNECFASENGIVTFLLKLIEIAAEAGRIRNFIVHGAIELRVNDPDGQGPLVTVKFKLTKKGKEEVVEMTQTEIGEFSIQLGFISGKLARFDKIQPDDALISLKDRSSLQDFLRKNHPSHPSLSKT